MPKGTAEQMLRALMEERGSGGSGEKDVFDLLTSQRADSEVMARARFNSEGMIVDLRCGTDGCPPNIVEFPSLNSWAAACKGRPVSVKPYIYYQGTSIRAYEDATVGPLGESRGTERPSKRRCGATVATPPKTPAGGAKRTDKGNDAVEESPEGHKAWEAGGRPKGVSNGSRTQGGSKHDAGKERTGHGGLGERTASWSKAEACAGSTEGTKPQKKWMGAEKQTSDEWQSVDTGKGLSYDKRRRGSQDCSHDCSQDCSQAAAAGDLTPDGAAGNPPSKSTWNADGSLERAGDRLSVYMSEDEGGEVGRRERGGGGGARELHTGPGRSSNAQHRSSGLDTQAIASSVQGAGVGQEGSSSATSRRQPLVLYPPAREKKAPRPSQFVGAAAPERSGKGNQPGAQLLGAQFTKHFEGYGTFTGEITKFEYLTERRAYYNCVYQDGDREDLTLTQLRAFCNFLDPTMAAIVKGKKPPKLGELTCAAAAEPLPHAVSSPLAPTASPPVKVTQLRSSAPSPLPSAAASQHRVAAGMEAGTGAARDSHQDAGAEHAALAASSPLSRYNSPVVVPGAGVGGAESEKVQRKEGEEGVSSSGGRTEVDGGQETAMELSIALAAGSGLGGEGQS